MAPSVPDQLRTELVRPTTAGVNVWRALRRACNPARSRSRLRADIEVVDFTHRRGERYCMVSAPGTRAYLRLGPDDRDLLDRLDGVSTIKEITVAHLQSSGALSLSAAADLVDDLSRQGMLERSFVPVAERATAAMAVRRSHLPSWAYRALRCRRIELAGVDNFFRRLHRGGAGVVFRPAGLVALTTLAVAGLAAFAVVVSDGRFAVVDPAVGGLVTLYLLNTVVLSVHESGHALACVHFRRRVNAAGFMLYLGMPAFYIDTSDMWMAPRRARMATAWAGPFASLVLGGSASLAVLVLPAGGAEVAFRLATLAYLGVAFNLVPLLRLDGYFVLMDALDEFNLRERSFAFVRHQALGRLRSKPPLSPQERLYLGYGLAASLATAAAIVFSARFWAGALKGSAVNAWAAGWVTGVVFTAVAAVVLAPLLRELVRLVGTAGRRVVGVTSAARRWGQRHWRAEAAELMAALPLTDDLPPEARAELVDRVEMVGVPAGASVVCQGERGDRFYVIRSGRFEVSQRDAVGADRVLGTLGRGRSFGELALLEATTRTATVRALEPGQVFAVSKAVFERILADRLEVAADVRRSLSGAARLRRLGPFLALGAGDLGRLQEHLVVRRVAPGEVVVRQGEEGHSFFVVESGRLEVVVDGLAVSHLEADAWFGELALLGDGFRAATVRALTPTTLVELGRDGFDQVLAASFRRGDLAPSRALSRQWEH